MFSVVLELVLAKNNKYFFYPSGVAGVHVLW